MSVFSGENNGNIIVKALRGTDVVMNEKIHHIKLSIAKAHDKNKDNEIISSDENSKISCKDDNINITTNNLNINSDTNFSDNINVANSIYLGDSNEELTAEILKELKDLLGKSNDYDFDSLDWGYIN